MNRQVKQHKYIDSFTSMVLTARKIAVTVNSRQYQGISVLSHKKSRTIFVVQYGSDVFCSGITCCVVKIDPHEKTRENGRFREISPVFSTLHFFEKIPIHFAIFSDRKDPNPRKRDFLKKSKPNWTAERTWTPETVSTLSAFLPPSRNVYKSETTE